MHKKNDRGVDPGAPSAAPQTARTSKGVTGMSDEKLPRQQSPSPQSARAGLALVALAGSVLALGGCVVGPKYVQPEVSANSDWSEKADPRLATGTAPDSTWWKVFNDSDARSAGRARPPAEPVAAGCRPAHRGGARATRRSRSDGSIPQIQESFASATAVGLSEHGPTGALVELQLLGLPGGLRRRLGGRLLGQVPAGRASRRPPACSRPSPTTTTRSSRSPPRSRAPTSSIRTFEVLIEQARAQRRPAGGGAAHRRSRASGTARRRSWT